MYPTDKTLIEFFKMRDLGQVLQVTFFFIRVAFKPLVVGISIVALPFFLIGTVFAVSAIDGMFSYSFTESNNQMSSLTGLMLAVLFWGLGSVMLITYVNELLKWVSLHPGQSLPSVQEVWHATRRYFWWNLLHLVVWFIILWMYMISVYIVFILVILGGIAGAAAGSVFIAAFMGILAFAAFLFLIFYFMAAATPIFFIATFERTNIFNALSRSFSLLHATKANFWTGIFTNVLSFFIQFIISGNVLLPVIIIQGVLEYNSHEDLDGENFKILFKMLYALSYLISPYLFVIPLIANGMNYFNMRERAEGIGLRKRIESIGRQEDFSIEMYEQK